MDDKVLLAYARAMRAAQRLEGRVKILCSLNNVILGYSSAKAPLSDEKFRELIDASDKKTLGTSLREVFTKIVEFGLSPFPENAADLLWEIVRTRNFLAHSYFNVRNILAGNKDAIPVLVAELEWYAELFESFVPLLDKWADAVLDGMGISEKDRKSFEESYKDIATDLKSEVLVKLKSDLERIGIELSQVPELKK